MQSRGDLPAPPGAPEFSVDREGVWRHRGEPILREALLRLLVSMLRRDRNGAFVLQGRGERVPIIVADAPLLVTEAEYAADGPEPVLWLTTRTGMRVAVDRSHPLLTRLDPLRGELRLYHSHGEGLEALVHRNVYYRLAELAITDPDSGRAGVVSGGCFFPLG